MPTNLFSGAFPLHAPGRTVKASPSDVRRNNRSLIFGMLFPSEQLSRAELGRRTGLSRVAVSDVVNEMLSEGLIRENGYETNTTGKGKRGTLLSIDSSRLHVISLDLSQPHLIQGAVTDLLGIPVQRMEVALSNENKVNVQTIIELIEQLTEGAGKVIGIGVAISGVVEANGIVRDSTMLGWHDVDLKTKLERHFPVPATVTNDVMSSMLTERFFGHGGANMLFVKIDRGIGAATLIEDMAILGENFAGGEIGHVSLDLNGPSCPCGKRGCLERLLSAPILRNRIMNAPSHQHARIIAQAGEYLAKALSMSIGLLDMRDVCIYGPPDIINDTFLESAQSYIDRATASSFHAHTVFRRCQCGGDITMRGGAIAVIRDHIERH